MPHLETGKYALFIWPAYGLTALMFIVLTVASLRHARRWKARAEAMSGR